MSHTGRSTSLFKFQKPVAYKGMFFCLQTESLNELSPGLLANVGVVCMSETDVGWRMMLKMWVDRRTESERELVRTFCDQYLEEVVTHLDNATQPPMLGAAKKTGPQYKRVIPHNNESMISTFTTLFEVK